MDKKTVFVIGAGASKEVNMPVGEELKQKIADLSNFKSEYISQPNNSVFEIYNAINIHVHDKFIDFDLNPYIHAALHIYNAMPQAISIDNFINDHKDNDKIAFCGKLAIVRSILEAENGSLLFSNTNNNLNFNELEKTWYSSFLKLLIENCTKENISEHLKSVVLIIFNYDRCIEHFLYSSFINYYGFEPDKAARLVNEIEIYHPYGVVGKLPWQDKYSVPFGSVKSERELIYLVDKIKTFTEGTDPQSSEIQAIRNNINTADTIVFLGFAYHELNMKLLMPENSKPDRTKLRSCFGTAFEISDHNCKLIENQLKTFFKRKIDYLNINNQLKCSGLFNEYWRSLSLV